MNKEKQIQLSEEIQKSLKLLNYEKATPVQKEVIPLIFEGNDVIVKSQTGSGKTASFVIPLCEKLNWDNRKPQGLILAPTRELVMQIEEDVHNIGRFKRIKVEAIYGRSSFQKQERSLREMTHVIVATPGRLLDHIEKGTVDLSTIEYLVIDEADEMLNMGFIEQIEAILKHIPLTAQRMLFSATMPESITQLASTFLTKAKLVEIEAENPVEKRITQHYVKTFEQDKKDALGSLLINENPDTAIIFCNTRDEVEAVAHFLKPMVGQIKTLHGGLQQRFRTEIIQDFKKGVFRYLVATDVAARGLDIEDVSLIINYDIPENTENYTHRIGRSARVDKLGKAISLVNSDQRFDFQSILDETAYTITEMILPKDEILAKKLPQFTTKQNQKPTLKQRKDQKFFSEITKIHINAGKKTKMRAGDIVGAICDIEGLSADDIGVIDILDVSTFVEILNNKGDLVLKHFETQPIKGRMRKVSRAYD